MDTELPQAPSLSLPLGNTGVQEFVLALPSKAQQDIFLTPNCSLQAYHSPRVKIVKQRLRLGPEAFNQIQTCL